MIFDLTFIKEFILAIITVFGIFLAFGVYFSDKQSKVNVFYFLTTISTVAWVVFGFLGTLQSLAEYSIWITRINYFFVAVTLTFVYAFIRHFPKSIKHFSLLDKILIFSGWVLGAISVLSPLVIHAVHWDNLRPTWSYGPLITVFNYYGIVAAILIIFFLIKTFLFSDETQRRQIKIFLYGICLVGLFNLIFNIILSQFFHNDNYNWIGDYSAIFLITFSAYAIVKHGLFNIKIIGTQAAVILISLILLVEAIVSINITEGLVKALIWAVVSYGGYILIKSVKTEIKQKENLEVLAKKLDDANKHLEDLDEQKDNFISMASHELNTPIAAIEGYLSMIIDEKMAGEINPKALKYLTNVYISSKRLASLVKDLLNVSRIESNRIHIIYSEGQVEDIIDQAVAEIAIKIKEVGHTLEWVRPKKLLPKTYLDMPRIIEVMINLLGNSIKYTDPPGKIKILAQADTEKIVVSVSDNGRGIPKDKYNHIFEKFSQVNVLKDQVKGTGLGMFISKNLIELHKGKLWFTSSVDPQSHGTTFYFSLPVLKTKPIDEHEGEGALFAVGTPKKSSPAIVSATQTATPTASSSQVKS